ncbi:MAG: hypothetical protein HKN68_01380 [Saprospiraceae bacterium]|nr:hypothetical protein [Saprospiraceae bacterium]
MKNINILNCKAIRFPILLFALFLATIGNTQSTQSFYIVQYLKVHPSMENEYLQLETEVWKKMQTARIEAGVLDAWSLYRVISPAGTKTEYNFVTILEYKTAEKLSGHFESYGVDYTSLLTAEEIAFALKTPEIRDLVYEEVWTSVDLMMKENSPEMHRFQVFNAMSLKPGVSEDEYAEIETRYWKPMHERRMNSNRQHGWGLFSMRIPGGTERAYHWATIDYFDRFIDIMQDEGNNNMIKIYGKKEADKITEKTLASRDLLRSEIRELLDYVNKDSIDN